MLKETAELLSMQKWDGRVRMDWLILALIGTVFFSGAGVLDKLLLCNCTKDSNAYIICQAFVQQLFTIPVILLVGIKITYPESIIALLFGCFQIIPSFFYMKALQTEEASKVSALEYVYPVFVFIGSIFFFGEILSPKSCVGGVFLIFGTILLSQKIDKISSGGSYASSSRFFKSIALFTPTIKPFLFYWILTAVYYLSLKYLLGSIDEWDLYIWSSLGSLIMVLPLLGKQSIRSEVKSFFGRGSLAIGALISEETFQFLGFIFSIFAYAIGSVTMVTSVGALQPILTVVLIMALGALVPKLAEVTNERTDRRSLMQKGVSFMVVLVGIYFVS